MLGSVQVSVQHEDGSAAVGSNVVLKSFGSQSVRFAKTDDYGSAVFDALPKGPYQVEVDGALAYDTYWLTMVNVLAQNSPPHVPGVVVRSTTDSTIEPASE